MIRASCYLPRMPPLASRSKTEDVYGRLRAAVLHGEVAAGDRLRLDALAAKYSVSLGVVREAVTRLASERLVESTPQSGFRVRPASPEHLADLMWARCRIERLAVIESVRYGDLSWEAALVAAHHVLSVTPLGGPDGSGNPAWMDAHRSFHAALAGGCPNMTLLVVRQQLFDEAEIYRHLSGTVRGPKRNIGAEHRAMLDAALQRDVELSGDLITNHIDSTARRAVESEVVASAVARAGDRT